MQWLEENAPWVVRLHNGEDYKTAVGVQLISEQWAEGDRAIEQVYWVKASGAQSWEFHMGILPVIRDGQAQYLVPGRVVEEDYLDQVDRTMNRGVRRRLRRALRELKVSEVYSQPRVTKAAVQAGMREGGAFDLLTGYDFNLAADRRKCMKKLVEEDPDLLVLSPPCRAFCQIQNLNYPRMGRQKAIAIISEGLGHLEFSMKLFEWQVRRGKVALFEHPDLSKAWVEPSVERVKQLQGVIEVRADQCQFGLRVREDEELNKKPTKFPVNSEAIARRLNQRCDGTHEHQSLMGGRSLKAQEYPPELCRQMVDGLGDEVSLAVLLGDADEPTELEELRTCEELEEARSEAEGTQVDWRARVTRSDRALVKKLHANLGHPSRDDLARALKMSRARDEIVQYVKNEFSCDLCEAHRKPKAARPAVLPRHFSTNVVVGIDVVYMPGPNPRDTKPVLNMIDWASCYQMLEPLESTLAGHVWERFMSTWGRTFGVPEMVVVDQGREFLGEFATKLNQGGCIIRTIGARSPWQQGRTERHGGLAKGVLEKVVDQVVPGSLSEWKSCVHAVEFAKNRLFNKSGFSPAQRQLGSNVRLPGSLTGEDVFDSSLVRDAGGEEVQRRLQMKEVAMEAFIKHSTEEGIRRASRARPRVTMRVQAGDKVFVFRKPIQRKRGNQTETRKAVWCGPGVVVLEEGANAWVSMRGEMWKCAKEQIRLATPEEAGAADLLEDELQELREDLGRSHSKRGFKDISQWAHPEDGGKDEGPVTQRPRQEEPQARLPSTSGEESDDSDNEREMPEIPDEQLEQAVQSVVRNEQLDGTASYEPVRRRLDRLRGGPYSGRDLGVEDEVDSDEEQPANDLWAYLPDERLLVRRHVLSRTSEFSPHVKRGCPIDTKYLDSRSTSVQFFEDGSSHVRRRNWRREDHRVGPPRYWTGYTAFHLRKKEFEQYVQWNLLASKGGGEVHVKDITAEEWPQWQIADGEEWSKVAASGAVRLMSLEESQDVERQLKEAGTEKRILPSRVVRRWKPAEQPGEPPTMKSRWCIRGDRDPDYLNLDRYAPTVNTAIISVALQVAASKGWKCALGDLKNAFMQSDRLLRNSGRLFCRPPAEGLPGVTEGQLIEILAGAYGLGDAPAHWRRSLLRVLRDLGYEQSAMDPCTFKLFKNGTVRGLVLVEVDDLLSLGDEVHYEQMSLLQKRFKFGKFKMLHEEEKGASFNGRRLRATPEGGFLIDMQKFIEERLHEVPMSMGRKKDLEAPATLEERSAARAAIGSLTWAAKEGRPDCAATASIIASCFSRICESETYVISTRLSRRRRSGQLSLCRFSPLPWSDFALAL